MSGGFLERWSQRKTDEGQTEPVASALDEAAQDAAEGAAGEVEKPSLSDEELAALPRIEDLTSESSLAPFLRAGVPSGLKNAAMRKMWLLTPAIRDHNDCAVDYHWDWNTPGGVPGAGGRLDPGAVQKMLRSLTDPHPAPATEAEKKPSATKETTSDPKQEAQAETPADVESVKRQAPASDPQSTTSLAEPANSERRKRHGGAMPS